MSPAIAVCELHMLVAATARARIRACSISTTTTQPRTATAFSAPASFLSPKGDRGPQPPGLRFYQHFRLSSAAGRNGVRGLPRRIFRKILDFLFSCGIIFLGLLAQSEPGFCLCVPFAAVGAVPASAYSGLFYLNYNNTATNNNSNLGSRLLVIISARRQLHTAR